MLSKQTKEKVQKEPEKFIEEEIKTFTRTSPLNCMPSTQDEPLFDEPLVRFADGDAPIFAQYKSVVAPDHLTPREALAMAYQKSPGDLPARLSVISFILPITERTRQSNRSQTKEPSRAWVYTRWYGEKFGDALRAHLVETLTGMGYLAAAPALQPYFKREYKENGPYSNWSERHMAYAAGHGTFSLSDGFITERGIAHRCGSIVTDLVLKASPGAARKPYANCLFYAGVDCRACIERCPAGAITEKGHNKIRCEAYMQQDNKHVLTEYNVGVAGCGLCQTQVPCEFINPTKKIKGQKK